MNIRNIRTSFKALGDDTRLRIINLLLKRDLTVGDICKILNKEQSTVSRHLARLRAVSLVKDHRDGSRVFYSLLGAPEHPLSNIMKVISRDLAKAEKMKADIRKMSMLKR